MALTYQQMKDAEKLALEISAKLGGKPVSIVKGRKRGWYDIVPPIYLVEEDVSGLHPSDVIVTGIVAGART